MTGEEERFRNIADSSGYLFQLGVEEKIRRTQQVHGWQWILREHAWSNTATGDHGFIDLVIRKLFGVRVVHAVIECRRRRDATWVFPIAPEISSGRMAEREVVALAANPESEGLKVRPVQFAVEPESHQSEFCSMHGTERTRTLEQWSSDLLVALDAFAVQTIEIHRSSIMEEGRQWAFIPVMVTTARLVVCEVEVGGVDLATGNLASGEFTEVPWVRFHKPLSVKLEGISESTTFDDLRRQGERTIFVVNAFHLSNVLGSWKMGGIR